MYNIFMSQEYYPHPDRGEEARNRAMHHLLHVLKQDPEYPSRPEHVQEDYMWDRLNRLEDENHLPHNLDAFTIYCHFIKSGRSASTDEHIIPPGGSYE